MSATSGRPRRPAKKHVPEALLLDEMFAPTLAEALTNDGFDVLAVVAHASLASASDPELARWASENNRRIVTENVRDFAPLVRQQTDREAALRVLFTSARRFPRSRRNPTPLHHALRNWLAADLPRTDGEWLR
ncbi:DUF5615 family PIN-like protein [Sporichthya polymorpha]|uniref:DUF5615 family PIN-like protein n=1 Tax=Sporichthya polymorpha TaxID=35751 RepID=UPI000381D1A8|nr:DUF5615 family PIN-like protein [Sporichthya polymorpha]